MYNFTYLPLNSAKVTFLRWWMKNMKTWPEKTKVTLTENKSSQGNYIEPNHWFGAKPRRASGYKPIDTLNSPEGKKCRNAFRWEGFFFHPGAFRGRVLSFQKKKPWWVFGGLWVFVSEMNVYDVYENIGGLPKTSNVWQGWRNKFICNLVCMYVVGWPKPWELERVDSLLFFMLWRG